MGYFSHHGIMVTGIEMHTLEGVSNISDVHKKAIGAKYVSNLSKEVVNGYKSFAIFPDGSKEGWPTSKRTFYCAARGSVPKYASASVPLCEGRAKISCFECPHILGGAEVKYGFNLTKDIGWQITIHPDCGLKEAE